MKNNHNDLILPSSETSTEPTNPDPVSPIVTMDYLIKIAQQSRAIAMDENTVVSLSKSDEKIKIVPTEKE